MSTWRPERRPIGYVALETIAKAALPHDLVEARRELRRRLDTPGVASVGQRRTRLETRLEQLKKSTAGDLSDPDYTPSATRSAHA